MRTELSAEDWKALNSVIREYAYYGCDCDQEGCIHEDPKRYIEACLRSLGLLREKDPRAAVWDVTEVNSKKPPRDCFIIGVDTSWHPATVEIQYVDNGEHDFVYPRFLNLA